MRKEIAPELYNYNKFPGPEFHQHGQRIETDDIHLNLLENYKEAFDLTVFNQRFSEILTKFDYIVGDWGNEQLRLRGFYRDDRPEEGDLKISRLQDYLIEYCNFGCAYFVLENPEPKRASFDKKSRHREKEKSNKKKSQQGKRSSRKDWQRFDDEEYFITNRKKEQRRRPKRKAKPRSHTNQNEEKSTTQNRHFVIRQK